MQYETARNTLGLLTLFEVSQMGFIMTHRYGLMS